MSLCGSEKLDLTVVDSRNKCEPWKDVVVGVDQALTVCLLLETAAIITEMRKAEVITHTYIIKKNKGNHFINHDQNYRIYPLFFQMWGKIVGK